MRFYLDSKKFFMRDELKNSFLLMSRITNETFDLPASWRLLLKYADRWVEFNKFLNMMMLFNFGGSAGMRERAEKIIYSLHAAGIVRIEDIKSTNATGTRLAKLSDYIALGEFCEKNFQEGFSCAVSSVLAYYSATGFFHRMEQGKQQAAVIEKSGKIVAALLCGPSANFFGGTVFTLQSYIFQKDMAEEECRQAITDMTEAINNEAKGKLNKLRYEYTHSRQDFVVSQLENIGFVKAATMSAEMTGGLDLILYDKIL